jgi:monoamine oxidase
MTSLDAVIVGGGISGLAVADGLVRSGLSVQVLEARSRTGGRLDTVAVPGGMADLGATWFWPGESRVQKLVAKLGLAIHDQWLNGDLLYVRDQRVERIDRAVAPPAFRFSGGAVQLTDGLSAGLPDGVVRLDSPVDRIERGDGLVRAHLADQLLEARVGVIALPPALAITSALIRDDDLEPALATVLRDIPVWMGSTAKAVAVYEQPFWRAAGLSGTAMCPGLPLQEIHDMSGPDGAPAMLFGFGQTSPSNPVLTAELATQQLAALFGQQAASPVDVIIRDWRTEQYTASTQWPPSQRYDLFGSPVLQQSAWDGGLYWTSTETASVAPGHIEGALEAAERTVAAIVQTLD